MTALFATRRFFNIDAVYDSELQKKLKNELNFLDPLKSFDELDARKEELQTVDYIFSTWGMLPLTKEQILEYFPNLKSVFYAAGTVQAFARPFLELGISVHSAWRANGVPVSEVTVSQIILANKGFFVGSRFAKLGNRAVATEKFRTFPGNYDTKVGIIGAGRFGPYIKHNDVYVSIPKGIDPLTITLEEAVELKVPKALFCGHHDADIEDYTNYPVSYVSPKLSLPFKSRDEEIAEQREEYQDMMEYVFCYDLRENDKDDILCFNIPYLKQNTKMFFPSYLFFKKKPENLRYEIRSKHSPEVYKGTLKLVDGSEK